MKTRKIVFEGRTLKCVFDHTTGCWCPGVAGPTNHSPVDPRTGKTIEIGPLDRIPHGTKVRVTMEIIDD